MNNLLFLVGALIAVSVLGPVLKIVIAALAGKQVGAAALARQPDQIHLARANSSALKNAAAVSRIADGLVARGFEDAGIYTIAEMPAVVVQLLANSAAGCYATIYEHPQAGVWFDLVSRFQDDTSVTYSTSPPTALNPRPGHTMINLRGADPSAVVDRALAQRPQRPLRPVAVDQAVDVFQRGYADSTAYRKQVGISTGEVVKTAARKAA